MVIAFQDSFMHICPATQQGALVPDGYLSMNDSCLQDAFDQLAEGHNVWVWQQRSGRHLLEFLSSRYQFVKAAGGLVSSPEGDCLMIYRQGRWDLPKGMVEAGETLAQAARREVSEETGIQPVAINSLIAKTYHIYDKYGGWHLKQTTWYAMESPRQLPRPQTEEEITQALWVPRQECLEKLSHSFASLILLSHIITHKEKTAS